MKGIIGRIGKIHKRDNCFPREIGQTVFDRSRVDIVKLVKNHHGLTDCHATHRIADKDYRTVSVSNMGGHLLE